MYINDIINTKVHEIDETNGLRARLMFSTDGSTVYCPGEIGIALIHVRSYTLVSTHIESLDGDTNWKEVILVG